MVEDFLENKSYFKYLKVSIKYKKSVLENKPSVVQFGERMVYFTFTV